MKRVSFEVEKAIKEAGYPQVGYYDELGHVPAPTYIETWLWLWREKHITLEPSKEGILVIECEDENCHLHYGHNIFSEDEDKDPEAAIEAAIKYLVDNDLIK